MKKVNTLLQMQNEGGNIMNRLIRFGLAILIGIIGYFFRDIIFIEYLVVGGFLAITAWSIAEYEYGSIDGFLIKLYMFISGISIIYYFIIPAIKGAFVVDKFGSSSSPHLAPGILFFVILFILIFSKFQKA